MSARVSTRWILAVGLLVALVLAGIVSFYASSHPDGLEHVAEQEGFANTAQDHRLGDGPMADYNTKGVSNERLAGGIAGVTGTLVVLVLAGGGFMLLRRRTPAEPTA